MAAPRIVSHSELLTARRCAFKHQIFYAERWTRPADPMSALGKGSAWHLVMEAHYNKLRAAQQKGIRDNKRILAACRKEVARLLADEPEELADLIWWMYDGYVALYGTDPEWQILAVEHPAQVRLPTPRGGRSQFILKLKIDLIIRERRTRHIKVVDHKSGKDLPGAKALELDDQFALYTWALNQLGHAVFGQVYNAARTLRLQADVKEPGTTPLAERFDRVPLYRTPKELDNIAVEAYQTASATYRSLAQARRDGRDAPRTTDPLSCRWQCDAFEPCIAGRKGIDWREFMKAKGFDQQFERH